MNAPAKISDVLFAAADLIEPEGAWTQEAFSRDADGDHTDDLVAPNAPVCWCALGAIAAASEFNPSRPFVGIARDAMLLLDRITNGDTPSWNDAPERTQPEVVAKLREAAELAREQGK